MSKYLGKIRYRKVHVILFFMFDQTCEADRKMASNSTSEEIKVRCRECRKKKVDKACVYYCEDCWIPLCKTCAGEHLEQKRITRHSVARVSGTFNMSPNQGPFPALTEASKIKFDEECIIRCSTFLLNGNLVLCDYTHSKLRMYGNDYTRKFLGSFVLPKVYACDDDRPKPNDITAINEYQMALTANNGKVYLISKFDKWNIELTFDVISFESNHGECLGIVYDDIDESLYVACTTDKEDSHFKIYDLNGELLRIVKDGINETPDFMWLDVDRCRLYGANADSVIVYNPTNFDILDHFTELSAHHRDIILDRYGNLYVLVVERRVHKYKGALFRLSADRGATRIMSLEHEPSSISYHPKTELMVISFKKTTFVFLYKLSFRTYRKKHEADITVPKEYVTKPRDLADFKIPTIEI